MSSDCYDTRLKRGFPFRKMCNCNHELRLSYRDYRGFPSSLLRYGLSPVFIGMTLVLFKLSPFQTKYFPNPFQFDQSSRYQITECLQPWEKMSKLIALSRPIPRGFTIGPSSQVTDCRLCRSESKVIVLYLFNLMPCF